MPIASGAAGRVDVGVDSSIVWAPDGVRKKIGPTSRNCDSYLRRYLEMTKANSSTSTPSQDKGLSSPGCHEDEGAQNEQSATRDEDSGEDDAEGAADGPPEVAASKKKSRLCVLL